MANKVNKIKKRDNRCRSRYLFCRDRLAVVVFIVCRQLTRAANTSESATNASVFVLSKGVE